MIHKIRFILSIEFFITDISNITNRMIINIFSIIFLLSVKYEGVALASIHSSLQSQEIIKNNLPIQKYMARINSENLSYQMRWQAVLEMAKEEGTKSLPILKDILKSPHWFIRNASLLGLKMIQPDQAYWAALNLINDNALVVRSAAVDVLSEIAQKNSVRKALWKALDEPINYRKSKSLWIRPQIIQILSKSPIQEELKTFEKYSKDKDVLVSQKAQFVVRTFFSASSIKSSLSTL